MILIRVLFPGIRAGASLKGGAGRTRQNRYARLFPGIRAGASLKGPEQETAAEQALSHSSPAFVPGPH